MKKLDNFKKSYIIVRIESIYNEKILNYLWKNSIELRKIKKNNAYSMNLQIKLKDYNYLRDIVSKSNGKMKIIDRKGADFLKIKLGRRKLLMGGIVIFLGIIYYLSGFIWEVNIKTDKYLSPLEVRNLLKSYGIMIGSRKSSLDMQKLEENIIRDIDEVMWVKTRIAGSKLSVEIIERQEPPTIAEKKYTGNIVASKDGIINRIYTKAGTSVKMPGDIVKAGDLIVMGQEGKEGMEFSVKAEGKVYATTFHEEIKEEPVETVERRRTGKYFRNYYINIRNKKVYIKNSLNNFTNYDKIENKNKFLNEETYYEIEEIKVPINPQEVIRELESKIKLNLDKSTKILSVIPEVKNMNGKYVVRVIMTVEENIAKDQSEVSGKGTETSK